jgi:hypothetical protein
MKVEVKVTLVHAMKARRGADVYLYFIFNPGTRWGSVVNATPRPLYPRETDQVPIVQESGWDPGPVWTSAENLAFTEIRSTDLQPVAIRCTG